MSKYSAEERLAYLKRVVEGREKAAKVCREAKVSRTLFYRWLARYQKASDAQKLFHLNPQKRQVYFVKGQTPPAFEKRILEIVRLHPDWSSKKIAQALGEIGNHGVQNVLKRLDLNTSHKRLSFTHTKGKVNPLFRQRMLERAVSGREPVAKICREYGLSRTLFYRLLARWEKEGKSLSALGDKIPQIKAYWRQANEVQVEAVIELVVAHPEYSVHRLAQTLKGVIGHHGVQNVLLRYGINTFDKRLEYAGLQAPTVQSQPTISWLGRLRSIFETFVPQMAPAPPPAVRQRVVSSVRAFAFSLISTSVFSLLLLFWLSMMGSAPTFGLRFGLFFASISLLIGTFFFLYSMKYYLTLALVLSFSTQTEEEPASDSVFGEARENGRKHGGWLSRIFGLSKGGNGENGNGHHGRVPAGGLQPNLDKVEIERYPFISVQLPFYNEKKVANRILSACTSFDYPNYEVLVCDDSTDETVDIVKEWEKHEKVKILHRPTREGFKGGALSYALKAMNSKTEFVVIFDADFVPYPDTLNQFIKYFKATGSWDEARSYQATKIQTMAYSTNGKVDEGSRGVDFEAGRSKMEIQEKELLAKSETAVVAGYQWHVLNKSENWITRGVRTEYAGSYVVERPGQEIMGAFKIIHGSVYCMRADVLKHFGWGTSITEDFELTLRIYQKGFKVIYTPYIQAPSECVSMIKRLIRQRMRWAEGHSFNVKKMFFKLMFSPKLTWTEKVEFLYITPYYLQAFFFLLGTFSWLVSETIFGARLPFWTSLWGWSLVLTNFFAMPLVNAVGLFLEESEEKDYLGLFSFIALSYLLVPFQAYAAIKGFIEPQEGTWFRTPKTGRITDVFARGRFYRWITGIIPGLRTAPAPIHSHSFSDLTSPYLALVTANNRFNNFTIKRKKVRWVGRIALTLSLLITVNLLYLSRFVPHVEAATDTLYFDSTTSARNASAMQLITTTPTNVENTTPNVTPGRNETARWRQWTPTGGGSSLSSAPTTLNATGWILDTSKSANTYETGNWTYNVRTSGLSTGSCVGNLYVVVGKTDGTNFTTFFSGDVGSATDICNGAAATYSGLTIASNCNGSSDCTFDATKKYLIINFYLHITTASGANGTTVYFSVAQAPAGCTTTTCPNVATTDFLPENLWWAFAMMPVIVPLLLRYFRKRNRVAYIKSKNIL